VLHEHLLDDSLVRQHDSLSGEDQFRTWDEWDPQIRKQAFAARLLTFDHQRHVSHSPSSV
jgi:hypothetical protein